MTKSKNILPPRAVWTDEMIGLLVRRYANETTQAIANDLGMKAHQVYSKASYLRLKKSAEFLASPASGRTNGRQGMGTRFEKGQNPWNKGKPFVAGGKSAQTRFKPGQAPHNTHEIGSYRITKDGTLQRKISNDKGPNHKRWRSVHELAWIEANGAVPAKHVTVFKKGMSTNKLEEITLDRIECVSHSELMKRNSVHNLPKELAELVQLRGAVNRQINQRSKQS